MESPVPELSGWCRSSMPTGSRCAPALPGSCERPGGCTSGHLFHEDSESQGHLWPPECQALFRPQELISVPANSCFPTWKRALGQGLEAFFPQVVLYTQFAANADGSWSWTTLQEQLKTSNRFWSLCGFGKAALGLEAFSSRACSFWLSEAPAA